MNTIEAAPKKATRIQRKNRKIILDAALDVFSTHGFRGSTVDQIAEQAGMSKPNLLYYFTSKEDIYVSLLEDTLAEWLQPLTQIDPMGDPILEIGRYIDAKLAISRNHPAASRLFASEIVHGAGAIEAFLRGPLKDLVNEKAAVIATWIDQDRLADVDPHHLIFMIWAVTQHYADFDAQVRAVLGHSDGAAHPTDAAGATVMRVFFDGLRPR